MPPRGYSKRPRGIAYHGYYCGPGWSAGEFQDSVSGGPDPIDELDRLCQKHDSQYASGYDKKRADREFYYKAMKLGYPKAMLAGMIVGTQGYFRKAGVQHWSKRPRLNDYKPDIQKTASIDAVPILDKNINSTEIMNRHTSFRQKMSGVAGYVGGFTKTHKTKKSKTDKYFSNVIETQGTISDANCCYIGHCTMPTDRAFRNGAFALFRAIFANRGFYIQDYQGNIPGNYRIQAQYRDSPAATPSTDIITDGVGTSSLDTHVEDFFDWYLTKVGGGSGARQIVFDSFIYTPYTSTGIIPGNEIDSDKSIYNLHASMLHLISINNLKLQNRTKHLAGTDQEETTTANDTAPLIGVIYGGKSSGMWTKPVHQVTASRLIADEGTGVIGYCPSLPAEQHTDLWEPPAASYFANCSRVGGLKLEPGEIKTSKLTSNYRASFSKFFQQLAPVFSQDYNVAYKQGVYNIFAMEKLLGIKTSALVQPKVELAYELNNKMLTFGTVKKQGVTAQRFEKLDNIIFQDT